MKTQGKVTLLLFVLSLIAALAVTGLRAQPPLGSYRTIGVKEKEVASAAKYAVEEEQKRSGKRYSLVKVLRAERQIVAGRNYKLCLAVKGESLEKTAQAVVYQDLQQQYALQSWEEKACKK